MTCAPSAAARGMPLVTGGSGLGMGLPEALREEGLLGAAAAASLPDIEGSALVTASSCSAATRTRIAEVSGKWPLRNLSPERLAEGSADRNCPRGVFRSRGGVRLRPWYVLRNGFQGIRESRLRTDECTGLCTILGTCTCGSDSGRGSTNEIDHLGDFGSGGRDRTYDQLINSQLLYR